MRSCMAHTNYEQAKLLIENGADTELLNNEGNSAFSYVRNVTVKAALEQALQDYTTLRACAPILK